MFIGMAAGSVLGSLALARGGWMAVTGLAIASAAGALIVRLWPEARAAA
jgi:predicted MFS family arabinose efflux permease